MMRRTVSIQDAVQNVFNELDETGLIDWVDTDASDAVQGYIQEAVQNVLNQLDEAGLIDGIDPAAFDPVPGDVEDAVQDVLSQLEQGGLVDAIEDMGEQAASDAFDHSGLGDVLKGFGIDPGTLQPETIQDLGAQWASNAFEQSGLSDVLKGFGIDTAALQPETLQDLGAHVVGGPLLPPSPGVGEFVKHFGVDTDESDQMPDFGMFAGGEVFDDIEESDVSLPDNDMLSGGVATPVEDGICLHWHETANHAI